MKDVSKGPGDLWIPSDDASEEAFEDWYSCLTDEAILEFVFSWMASKTTATGPAIRTEEFPMGPIATISYDHEANFQDWLYQYYLDNIWLVVGD